MKPEHQNSSVVLC